MINMIMKASKFLGSIRYVKEQPPCQAAAYIKLGYEWGGCLPSLS